MIISIASGKGGTGKTTVAVNLALSLNRNVQFLDCDVEEPNAHIFLKPEIIEKQFVNIPVPKIDESKCTYCGKCQEVCVYNAIAVIHVAISNIPNKEERKNSIKDKVLVFRELCHGCGGCNLFCPEKAIEEVDKQIGIIQIGKFEAGGFVNGQLNISEPISSPLIRAVKKNINNDGIIIIDAPPGTSCPVIESIKGSDYCILVTEPTPFGLNDLILAVEVIHKLKIPFGIIINRSNIGDEEVDKYCSKENIPILMKIPFDRKIAEAYSKGISMIEVIPEYRKEFKKIFEKLI